MRKRVLLDLTVIIAYRTDKAVLVKSEEDADGVWLPLSQVEVDGEIGEIGLVTMPEWLAQEKGLI